MNNQPNSAIQSFHEIPRFVRRGYEVANGNISRKDLLIIKFLIEQRLNMQGQE